MDAFLICGGIGTRREMHNWRLLEFVRGLPKKALRVSACIGAWIHSTAGILDGIKTTSRKNGDPFGATAFRALPKARMRTGYRVATFGAGGFGPSGIQLARTCGANHVLAIDIAADKRALASHFSAHPIDPVQATPDEQIRAATGGRGVDVALEFTGIAAVQEQPRTRPSIDISCSPYQVRSTSHQRKPWRTEPGK